MYITGLSLLSLTGFAIIALIVAVRDIRTMVIPNGLTLTLLCGYLLVAAASGWSRDEIAASLIAAAMVLFVGLLLSAMGWLPEPAGSSISKFAAVCSLWLGASQILSFLGLSALIGGLCALLLTGLPRARRSLPPGTGLVPAASIANPSGQSPSWICPRRRCPCPSSVFSLGDVGDVTRPVQPVSTSNPRA
ncbi:Flp pilus assembly protein, protease CpaA [Thalassovita autumnalis]|uniref:Flp pilus assembly protein, protease CpaA n=1 Tax=Thalassovita autumnalis TaxID=2072972 RepID=A0A0P1F9K8_9RHOB|nr:Flp pilus assembly protein, protease CpaA [Thalassovita autumnalis]CUH73771.1 Flp pilus assembly protein, protease CpaA [Thalassovita autumnalis]